MWEIILPQLDFAIATAIEISLQTGMRISDVLELKRENIDERGVITYTAKKTGKSASAKLSEKLTKRLKGNRFCGSDWIFSSARNPAKHISRQWVWKTVKRAAKRLSLKENVSPHSARKTFAVEDFQRNDIERVREDLQHDSVYTTMLYAFADKMKAQKGGKDESKEVTVRQFAEMVAQRVAALLRKLY